jgi:hypothetical protein
MKNLYKNIKKIEIFINKEKIFIYLVQPQKNVIVWGCSGYLVFAEKIIVVA